MAATSLLTQLRADYPHLTFAPDAELFYWSASDQIIHIGPTSPHPDLLTLHELGHATLGHTDYTLDISLLEMEVAAWSAARTLADHYQIAFDQDFVEQHLDTYRDWIHRRSECPHCHQTGYQTPTSIYHCPSCLTRWRTKINRLII
jgi:hypothetical protein